MGYLMALLTNFISVKTRVNKINILLRKTVINIFRNTPVDSQYLGIKDRDSTGPKRGSVFIGLMTPDGAIWSRYQRAALMR